MGLKEGVRPTFSQVKEAYREKLVEHPGQGEATTESQEIDEATRVLLQFLADNPLESDITNSEEEDKDLLREFEKKANVVYNKDSVTFHIEEEKAEEWTKCFTEYFGFVGDTSIDDRVFFSSNNCPIPLSEEKVEGCVAVHVYPAAASGAKVLVQGKLYIRGNH